MRPHAYYPAGNKCTDTNREPYSGYREYEPYSGYREYEPYSGYRKYEPYSGCRKPVN